MSRSERLFALLAALRRLPSPATAAQLAAHTGVSVRSIYRDIDSLRAGGARIDGERGYGYTLVEDGALPPQTFSRIELEALILGLSEVRHMGDPALSGAAQAVLDKVAATLPSLSQRLSNSACRKARRCAGMPSRERCNWRTNGAEICSGEDALRRARTRRAAAASGCSCATSTMPRMYSGRTASGCRARACCARSRACG